MTSNDPAPEASLAELQDRVADLTRANALLADADRRKHEFLATLAHDLRNPVATLAGSVELLRTPGLEPAEQQRLLDILQRQVQQLSLLVDERLSAARAKQADKGRSSEGKPPGSQDASPSPFARRRILLVDDSIDAAESLARLLTYIGQEVQVAHDGTTALQRAQLFQPEMILLDIGLPGMNGFEVARRLRQLPDMKTVLLVALTGHSREEDPSRYREAGFDQHLVKPVTLKTIEQLLTYSIANRAPI